MSLLKYKEYKDSGVEWLGQVPKHWEISRIRYLTDCLDGKRIPLNSEERSTRIGEVPYWGANSIVGYVDTHLFDEELVLLGEDGAPFFDRNKPVAFLSTGPVWPNNHIHVLKPKLKELSKYLVYALNVTDYANFIDGSTRDKLTQSEMNSIQLALPLFNERNSIVKFLDYETTKIDSLIAEQEKLIELLKEKRQAIISHAVTKGLNPDVEMKDSGVEWLGIVPKTWIVTKLKYVLRKFFSGGTPDTDTAYYWCDNKSSEAIPWVSISDITRNNIIQETEKSITHNGLESKNLEIIPKNVLLYSIYASLGKVAVTEIPVAINQAILGLETEKSICSTNYLKYWLLNSEKNISFFSSNNTQNNLNASKVKGFYILKPNLTEQAAIASFLDHETAKIDELTKETFKVIELLKERRSALISAAVTGQIDVRNFVPKEAA
jgi:type I restriction enzyme S subunit